MDTIAHNAGFGEGVRRMQGGMVNAWLQALPLKLGQQVSRFNGLYFFSLSMKIVIDSVR